MITPSFGLTATERVLPKLALDFTTATLDPRVTFTRSGNTATYINSSGIITAINANLPRFDYNPTTLVCKGLLIEETRKNLFLNSLIDGTDLLTQIVTTTATATTISFYGTGSIVLSGTHSATVNGLGAYPIRTTYTFTPTAGALTATVSSTVQYAQIEAGAFATSFIPTDSTVGGITRNADVATMTGTNFSSWFNASEGAFVVQSDMYYPAKYQAIIQTDDGTSNNRIYFDVNSSVVRCVSFVSGVNQCLINLSTPTANTTFNVTGALKLNSCAAAMNAGAVGTDNTATMPTVNRLLIGSDTSNTFSGHFKKINYYPQRLINAEVQSFSK